MTKDDHDKDGPDKAQVFGALKAELKPGVWQTVRMEIVGDRMLGKVGDVVAFGSHEQLAGPKSNFGLTVAGESASFRNFKLWEATPNPDWEKVKASLPKGEPIPPPRAAPAKKPAGKLTPKVAVEFRIAEEQPAPGLAEMVVRGGNRKVYVHGEALLTNADIESASLAPAAGGAGAPQIEIVFTKAGEAKFTSATARSVGRPLAILIDGEVISAPVVRETVYGHRAVISGAFSREEAQRIADGLAGGR